MRILGLSIALPTATALPKNSTKIYDLLADLAQGPALRMELIVTNVITEGKHEKSEERALSKQNGVEGYCKQPTYEGEAGAYVVRLQESSLR